MVESMRDSGVKLNNLAVAICVLLTAACTKEQPPKPDSVAPASASYYPGLNADSASVLENAASWDSIAGHRWDGNLDCDDGSTCDGQTSVAFRIVPRINAHLIDQRKILADPTQGGAWVAKLTNNSSFAYGPWKIGAHQTVFLWVGPLQTGIRRVAIAAHNPATSPVLVTARSSIICDAQHDFAQVQVYQPLHCTTTEVLYRSATEASTEGVQPASNGGFAMLASNRLAATIALSSAAQGLWVSCTGGCCEASAFQ